MKSREEQLIWAKQRALACVASGRFANAVSGLRADLDENPLTKGVMSSDHARPDTKPQGTRPSAGVRSPSPIGSKASAKLSTPLQESMLADESSGTP